MDNFIPTPGLKGLYSLKEPFNTALLPGVLYEAIAIRSIADIIASGGDPFTDIYLAKNITKEKYQSDVTAGVMIVSLRAAQGQPVYVPSSYIQGAPDIGGVPYTSVMLAISLAPIPDALDLSFLKQRLADAVFETLGVRSTISTIEVSEPTVLSQAEHDSVEAARVDTVTANKTDYAKYLAASVLLEQARARIAELENHILANN